MLQYNHSRKQGDNTKEETTMTREEKFQRVLSWCEEAILQSGNHEWFESLTDKQKHDAVMCMITDTNKALDRMEVA
jgi:hypothetical protein